MMTRESENTAHSQPPQSRERANNEAEIRPAPPHHLQVGINQEDIGFTGATPISPAPSSPDRDQNPRHSFGTGISSSPLRPGHSSGAFIEPPATSMSKVRARLDALDPKITPAFSFEVFPPRSITGLDKLYARLDYMSRLEPLFVSVTCSDSDEDFHRALEICKYAKKFAGILPLLHLTCSGRTTADLRECLRKAKLAGIQNILALRGTLKSPEGLRAADLVKLIKQEYGDNFCVGVGAYPEGYTETDPSEGSQSYSMRDTVRNLKHKVDCGAEFVLTQFFFNADSYSNFMQECNNFDVQVPIIPGVMPIISLELLHRLGKQCGVQIPSTISAALQPFAGARHVDGFKNTATKIIANHCDALLNKGSPGLHFYSLNLDSPTTNVLFRVRKTIVSSAAALRRMFPWRASQDEGREEEGVRPIFWANRQRSYVMRTSKWKVFPRERWGDVKPMLNTQDGKLDLSAAEGMENSSPGSGANKRGEETITVTESNQKGSSGQAGFAELTDSIRQFSTPAVGDASDRKAIWGEAPTEEQDIWQVFVAYLEGKVPRLPWCETALHPETNPLQDKLLRLNGEGFLTINSQPRVNAAASDDPIHGWGGPGGYVYQKGYIECFTPPSHLAAMMQVAKDHPSITFNAVDSKGNSYTNCKTRGVHAVTWGVFPGKEVIQPTVVDPEAFLVWKDEAFSLWQHTWAAIYDEESPSADLIDHIYNTYYLVNVVDNDFMKGDIFSFFNDALLVLDRPPLPGFQKQRRRRRTSTIGGGAEEDHEPGGMPRSTLGLY